MLFLCETETSNRPIMAGRHGSEELGYGFNSDITAHVQSSMHGSFVVDNLVSQMMNRSPNGQVSIGFSHLEVGADESRDPLNRPEEFSSLDMSSALSSVAINRIWDFKTRSVDLFSPSAVQEDSTVSQPENLNEIHEGASSPAEDLQTVTFKYFDFFPLYQDYFLQTVRDEAFKLKDLDVSELIRPQYFQGLKQKRDSDVFEPEDFVGLQSPLSPCGSVEVASLCSPHVGTPPRSASLWQELEEVKVSGLLKILTPKEIGLQESTFELISSETSYLKSLGVVVSHFYVSEALKKTMSKMEHNILFSNICQVMAASAKFLKNLETRLDENPFISQVGDIVLKHSQDFHQHYVRYVSDMPYQESLVNQLMVQNQHFVYVLKKLENDPKCERHPLKSFLVLPFQRITRIKLLLEGILKLTETNTDSASSLIKAIDAIHEILTSCDKKVKRMKQIEELICLEMLLDFGNIKAVPLVTSARFRIHQGSMKWLTSTNGSRMSFITIHLHLFNDLLIISSKKYQRFMVVDHALFPAHVTVQHLQTEALRLPPDSFLLHLSQSQVGPPTAMVLVANTRSDKEVWMKALSSKSVPDL